jgi:mRNA interferase MazF
MVSRGELWWVDFGVPFGSEPGFRRPALIVQDDLFNESKIRTVIVLPLTGNLNLADAPGNLLIESKESKLPKDSVILGAEITTIDKAKLIEKISKLKKETLHKMEQQLLTVLGFPFVPLP